MLFPRLEIAMTNAKKLRVHHESQGRTLPSKKCDPSTQVDLLVAKLRLIKDESSVGRG
ncbi:MAG: hypothetical protein HPY73_01500 [Methanomassiliicoccales archaeon]|nr:MAG: hypothetical protein HPY73_01500 [Methanomassiliicoccales archaeon]